MSFKSRDLMANVLPAGRFFACSDATKSPGEQCVDPTKAPVPPPPSEIAQDELNFALLRDQLREALTLEQAARG